MSRDIFRILLALALAAAGTYSTYNYSLRAQRQERVESFTRRYIKLVQANDLQAAYYRETSERFRKLVGFDKFARDYALAFRKLGELVSYKTVGYFEPQLGRDYYQLDCEARYQRDTGHLRFTLELEQGHFRLSGFFVYGDHWEKLTESVEQ